LQQVLGALAGTLRARSEALELGYLLGRGLQHYGALEALEVVVLGLWRGSRGHAFAAAVSSSAPTVVLRDRGLRDQEGEPKY
jgi:hypothetical protein